MTRPTNWDAIERSDRLTSQARSYVASINRIPVDCFPNGEGRGWLESLAALGAVTAEDPYDRRGYSQQEYEREDPQYPWTLTFRSGVGHERYYCNTCQEWHEAHKNFKYEQVKLADWLEQRRAELAAMR